MLTINNLTIIHDQLEIVYSFGVTMFAGCALNIYGPNGCGKTLLMRHIIGLAGIKPGHIYYDQIDVQSHQAEYRLMGEYVGHNLGLKDDLKVKDNLAFWARLYDTELLLAPAIHTMKLTKYHDHMVRELSMGTKKRVALARLLVTNSTLWFLDEPFANLDQEFVSILQNMIKARCEQKGIVVFTSHAPINEPHITNINICDFRGKNA